MRLSWRLVPWHLSAVSAAAAKPFSSRRPPCAKPFSSRRPPCAFAAALRGRARGPDHSLRSKLGSEWTVADNWDSLSSENSPVDTSSIFNVDLARGAALSMEQRPTDDAAALEDRDDAFVRDAVDSIINPMPDGTDPPLFDTAASLERYAETDNSVDDMGKEIGLLIRCNKRPEDLLVREGRALPPLTDEERYDPAQLVASVAAPVEDDDAEAGGTRPPRYEPTKFFDDAVSGMFREHAVSAAGDASGGDGPDADAPAGERLVLDAAAVARWMSKSLGESVGRHDKRVLSVISRYGSYGSGVLTKSEFKNVYLDAIIAGLEDQNAAGAEKREASKRCKVIMKQLKLDQPGIRSVWRDFTNHGIISPAETERKRQEEELKKKYGDSVTTGEDNAAVTRMGTMMDECEILEMGEHDHSNPRSYFDIGLDDSDPSKTVGKGSHEYVELASDNATPKRIRDGQFVFIDEESCIGCSMCAQIAPSSFVMLDNGRARTFSQSNSPEVASAVSSCPVNCMHHVAFHELKEFESARDRGDGRTDHRHLGPSSGHTPLNVAGIDSDANRKSSWYHYLKQKCYVSSGCPQRGCYDCPMFSEPGENPYFKELHKNSESVRAQDFIASGDAETWRKTAEL